MAENRLSEPDDSLAKLAEDKARQIQDRDEALRWMNEELPIRTHEEQLRIAIAQRAKQLKKTEAAVRQDYLEAELGPPTVNRWLTPKINISREEAVSVALFLKMSPEKTEEFLKQCQFYKTNEELDKAITERALEITTKATVKAAEAAIKEAELAVEEAKKLGLMADAREAKTTLKKAKTTLKAALKEDKAALKEALEEKFGEESVTKWLLPRSDIGRDKAIKIAFVLKMPYEKADGFLKWLRHDGFHMRNVEDYIYRYGLGTKWGCEAVFEMAEAFSYLNQYDLEPLPSRKEVVEKMAKDFNKKYPKSAISTEDAKDFILKRKGLKGGLNDELPDSVVTPDNVKDFIQSRDRLTGYLDKFSIRNGKYPTTDIKDFIPGKKEMTSYLNDHFPKEGGTKKDIVVFILKKRLLFGLFRRTQYNTFMDLYALIGDIETRNIAAKNRIWEAEGGRIVNPINANAEEMESIRVTIVKNIHTINTRSISPIMREILTEGIPAARERLSEIISGAVQVDRKFLILAWLSCLHGDISAFQVGGYGRHVMVLNNILIECGMASLDSRHPFDWMIMHILSFSHDIQGKANKNIDDIEDIIDANEELKKFIKRMNKMRFD